MNDLSIHGQFGSTSDFYKAIDRLMEIRTTIKRAGSDLFCHRKLTNAQVTPDLVMPQAIQGMGLEKRQAWIQWLTRVGPYWIENRQHSDDEWLETTTGTMVTDSAVGEAAFCRLHRLQRETVSVDPSDWLQHPLNVIWRKSDDTDIAVEVPNHWTLESVTKVLDGLPKPYDSWTSLEEHLRRMCDSLILADGAFAPLEGHPYVKSVAEGIHILLDVLNKLDAGFDDDGNRTDEFESLYETYFKGEAPYFTDESDTNKRGYESKLTFPHPTQRGQTLFCSWHGKVNSPRNFPPIRIHFTWPATAETTLCVVYVGPKITTR